jgi:hypothetical protein
LESDSWTPKPVSEVKENLKVVDDFLFTTSFGQVGLTYELYHLPIKFNGDELCQPFDWRDQVVKQIPNFSRFGFIQMYLPSKPGYDLCRWDGLGNVWGQFSWIKTAYPWVIIHEMGHNWGLWHACSVDSSGTLHQYGDYFSVMGRSWPPVRFSSKELQTLGWLTESEVYTSEDPGVITLKPLYSKGLDGYRAAKFVLPSKVELWVELRVDKGEYDSDVPLGIKVLTSGLYANDGCGTLVYDADPSDWELDLSVPGYPVVDKDFRVDVMALTELEAIVSVNFTKPVLPEAQAIPGTSNPPQPSAIKEVVLDLASDNVVIEVDTQAYIEPGCSMTHGEISITILLVVMLILGRMCLRNR